MIRRIGVNRVLFGSDWPWFDPLRAIGQISKLGFSGEEEQMILGKNAARVFGLGSPDAQGEQGSKEQ